MKLPSSWSSRLKNFTQICMPLNVFCTVPVCMGVVANVADKFTVKGLPNLNNCVYLYGPTNVLNTIQIALKWHFFRKITKLVQRLEFPFPAPPSMKRRRFGFKPSGGFRGGCIPPHQPKSNDFGQKISLYFE